MPSHGMAAGSKCPIVDSWDWGDSTKANECEESRRLNLTNWKNWLFCYARCLRGSGGTFPFQENTTTQAQSLSISVLGWTAHLARLDLDHSVKAEANFSLSFECWESFQEIPISGSLVSERQWQLRHRGKTFWWKHFFCMAFHVPPAWCYVRSRWSCCKMSSKKGVDEYALLCTCLSCVLTCFETSIAQMPERTLLSLIIHPHLKQSEVRAQPCRGQKMAMLWLAASHIVT